METAAIVSEVGVYPNDRPCDPWALLASGGARSHSHGRAATVEGMSDEKEPGASDWQPTLEYIGQRFVDEHVRKRVEMSETTLECPCCGDDGAVSKDGLFHDGQSLVCGCVGWVSVDENGDVWINNGDDQCPCQAGIQNLLP